MEQKALKTSWTQRIVILVIAVLLLGSTVFAYLFLVVGGSSEASKQEEKITQLTEEFDAKSAEIDTVAKRLSEKYFSQFSKYQSEVKSYNAASVNGSGLVTKDLKEGNGKTLTEGDTDYYAYYISWCANGDIFSSTFNYKDEENKLDATSLTAPFDPGVGPIEGWNQGVIGMKIGGVRQVSIPGELAYSDKKEICGGYNSPLRYIIYAIDKDAELAKLNGELDEIWLQLYYLYYGNTI